MLAVVVFDTTFEENIDSDKMIFSAICTYNVRCVVLFESMAQIGDSLRDLREEYGKDAYFEIAQVEDLNGVQYAKVRTCYEKPHYNLTSGKDFLTVSGVDCSVCGGRLDLPVTVFYCPNCGAKVVKRWS